jgi:hypothetical protein
MTNQENAIENLKKGIAMAEIARITGDKKAAKLITGEAMNLINTASKAFIDDPENWCPTPPIPWPWPWKNPRGLKDIFGNEIVKFSKIDVLNSIDRLKTTTDSPQVQNAISKIESKLG